ncbi:MAG: metallophosphoesterase [Planctomycetia bacterium]|nr:metallophosphoesterase [Planctomycetia bacterium]
MTFSNSTDLSRRAFIKRIALGSSLFCMSAQTFAETLASDSTDAEVVLRFAALSDVHLKSNRNVAEVDRFERAIQFMYDYSATQAYADFDAMLVAGDFSDHGFDDELAIFKDVMDKGIRPGTQTVLCMGNHEFISGNKKRWEEIFERDSNKVYDVKGYRFIALSPDKGSNRNGDFQYALKWYQEALDDAMASSDDKPVFTFQHYHVTPTVYGSRGEDCWGIADLYPILSNYPRVINFSGHSHYPINDPRSAWQGGFTAFGTGTLSYFEMGGEGGKYNKFPPGCNKAAQMYMVEVRRDNSVVLKPYDLITNSFFDVVYYVKSPNDPSPALYTDERYQTSAAPKWDDDASVDVLDVEFDAVKLRFPQATCPDVVHSYRVDLEKADSQIAQDDDIPSQYFWSQYYFKDCPKVMTTELDALDPATTYKAKIVALNPFFKESQEVLNASFTTAEEDGTVDRNAPTPQANFIDVRFEKDGAQNLARFNNQEPKNIEVFGDPKVVAEPLLNGAYVGIFNGKDDRVKIQCNDDDYRRLRRATINAKFYFEEYPKGCDDIFANTENAGVCLELNGPKKEIQFWACVNGRYEIIAAPIEPKRYHDVYGVYDGQESRLYVDGKLVASRKVRGRLTHPSGSSTQAFCVGSDIAANGDGSSYFTGRIARARLYAWALSESQVQNLTKQSEE